jgi:hypothetical protein
MAKAKQTKKAAVGKAALSALIPGARMFGGRFINEGRTPQQPGPPAMVLPTKKGRKRG